MAANAKTVRAQLALLQPLVKNISLKTIRKGQNRIGELMGARHKEDVLTKKHSFPNFEGLWIVPKDTRRQGIILYLHGGGFTCGDLEYAGGFGSTLAVECGCRVFCPGYRLAPETPFPGAVEDVLESYRYLLSKGYSQITLCGESAGGGLCYSLCMRLRQLGLPMPCGIITISPWVDLTLSGETLRTNRDRDVSLSEKQLRFFASAYTKEPKDPMASPIFGDLSGLPASLIFAGGDEILLSDSLRLRDRLLEGGSPVKLLEKQDRWHGYLLYDLEEDRKDYAILNGFLDRHMSRAQKLRWMKLDNAAKIYPAARNADWSNIFRLSATLTEEVDVQVLQNALDITLRRFPSFAVQLRRGLFWYYLQELEEVPKVQAEYSYPLTKMSREEVRRCAIRVIAYENRIALELFHSITDGNGALVFLKTLVAEYLQQKYGISIPAKDGVLGRLEEPSQAEQEDSFPKYAGTRATGRQGSNAWRLSGTPEPDGFQNVTCMTLSVEEVRRKAKEQGVTMTCFLAGTLLLALQQMQAEQIAEQKYRKPLKVQIPVDLRRIFPSQSLRNFALYTCPEIDPRLGEYSFAEICAAVKHRMGLDVTPKQMSMMIAANVGSEKLLAVRIMPLFVKNLVMKAVFNSVGERKTCLSLSNLGQVKLPEEMQPYVQRLDFILGVQNTAPHNCGVLSYGDKLYINFIRDTRESDLEYRFYCCLRDMGLQVTVESNRREG